MNQTSPYRTINTYNFDSRFFGSMRKRPGILPEPVRVEKLVAGRRKEPSLAEDQACFFLTTRFAAPNRGFEPGGSIFGLSDLSFST